MPKLPPLPGYITIGSFRPKPGEEPDKVKLPGPGTYEADFSIPGWMVPDFDSDTERSIPWNGHKLVHMNSRLKGDDLTIRFRIEEDGAPPPKELEVMQAGIPIGAALSGMAKMVRPIAFAVGSFAIAKTFVEARKLVKMPVGQVMGIGGAVLAAGLGIFLLKK